ncbi:hypothetical protein CaCOL14_010334 [Colletotrichum acutatum]|uniref:Phenylacetaldoxime dehydratase family protein n=1 Tax=Glomerella acutata TaxID=27357 RepID=A0AAD8UEN2_GLOAC|nr:putative phenylacetaldoxime dehydratase family protein [Colletotrichum acutatum]KAK1722807.1 putative phenylacetaldoxime dehydratase family protein [Colletotrichum acutatum]
MSSDMRTYPLRRPEGHRPPVPRWQLTLCKDVQKVFTAYIGIQPHRGASDRSTVVKQAVQAVEAWLSTDTEDRPLSTESFNHLDGDDAPNTYVWVCYWDDPEKGEASLQKLDIASVYAKLAPEHRMLVGLWRESFTTPISRLETNYSGLDYLPGLARLPKTGTKEHQLSAYWGAARDRIPASAHDLFEEDGDAKTAKPEDIPVGLGQHLTGTNYDNIVHIRSGQFWENCCLEEALSYETELEPTLKAGLGYLWENREKGGAMGLRFLGNRDADGHTKKETCGAGFFMNLSSLEEWSKKHRSHLAIYIGAIKHAKTWGESRKFRTWHEVSVLKRGEATFEYLNCSPVTGVMRFISLPRTQELM